MLPLDERLENEVKHYTRRAIQNYRFAYASVAATILCSGIAGVAGIAQLAPQPVTGILALVPALSSLAAAYLKPQGRSNYHYRMVRSLEAFYRRLVDQKDDPAEISKEWNELAAKMNMEWEANFGLDASLIVAGYRATSNDPTKNS
jgi:hypothetical protein